MTKEQVQTKDLDAGESLGTPIDSQVQRSSLNPTSSKGAKKTPFADMAAFWKRFFKSGRGWSQQMLATQMGLLLQTGVSEAMMSRYTNGQNCFPGAVFSELLTCQDIPLSDKEKREFAWLWLRSHGVSDEAITYLMHGRQAPQQAEHLRLKKERDRLRRDVIWYRLYYDVNWGVRAAVRDIASESSQEGKEDALAYSVTRILCRICDSYSALYGNKQHYVRAVIYTPMRRRADWTRVRWHDTRAEVPVEHTPWYAGADDTVPLSKRGIVGWVFARILRMQAKKMEEEGAVVQDPNTLKIFRDLHPAPYKPDYKSLVLVAIWNSNRSQLLGLLRVDSTEHTFSETDLYRLKPIAEQIGWLLETTKVVPLPQ